MIRTKATIHLSALLLSGLVSISLTPFSAQAETQMVNWTSLNLNRQQDSEINRLETDWQRAYSQVYPQLQRDKQQLRKLLNDPNSTPQEVMAVQNRIMKNEQYLKNEATRIFVQKKNTLDPVQKQSLQKMMP